MGLMQGKAVMSWLCVDAGMLLCYCLSSPWDALDCCTFGADSSML